MILAILVGITMWVQQKMVTPTNQDPRTGSAKPDDALDDAYYVYFLQFIIPQRFGTLLGSFKYLLNCGPVLCDRMGRAVIRFS